MIKDDGRMYGSVGSFFWLKLVLLLVGVFCVISFFNIVTNRLLKVKGKSWFLAERINRQHYKLDWLVRIIFIGLMIIGFFVNSYRNPLERIFFLEPYFLLFTLIFATELLTAIMEWKYESNRNTYKATLIQLLFMMALVILIYSTNFFGLFEW